MTTADKPELTDEHKWFLEDLRQSGETNMFGAGPYLQEEFALDKKEASALLVEWMRTYNRDDYK